MARTRSRVRTRMRFTDRSIRALKGIPGRRYVVSDTTKGCSRLKIRITESGAKSYFFLYRVNGQSPQWLRLGTPDEISLADVRRDVKTLSGDVLKGIDPIAERRKAEAARLEAE